MRVLSVEKVSRSSKGRAEGIRGLGWVACCHARELGSLCKCAERLYHRCLRIYIVCGLLR
jgi:hypothetical protein